MEETVEIREMLPLPSAMHFPGAVVHDVLLTFNNEEERIESRVCAEGQGERKDS